MISYELYMTPDDSNPAILKTDSNGEYIEVIGTVNSVSYPNPTTQQFTPATSYSQRLIQQTSYMYQNRPIYAVAGKSADLVTYRN